MMKEHSFIHNKDGQSVLEVIVALAIFSLIAAAMVTLVTGSFTALVQGGEHTEAEALAQEGIEAIRSIRDNAWNTNTYTTSSVSVLGSEWMFDGEGTTETIGQYTRTISFEDVCRDGSDDIVACPGSYTDVHTKQVTVAVSWTIREDITNTVERIAYFTNWDSAKWIQTDWSGGSGQSIWSDATMYESDDGGVDGSTVSGQLQLASIPRQEACEDTNWSFDTPGNYTYDNQKIVLANGKASLKLVGATANNTWPFSSSSLYTFDSSTVEVSGGYGQLVYVDASTSTVWDFDVEGNYTFNASSIAVASSLASLIPQGGALGTMPDDDVTIDTLVYDGSQGTEMDMVHVTGTIYAIAYRDNKNDGWLKTVDISTNGTIDDAIIDTEEFDGADGRENRIIKVGDNMVAMIYRGSGSDGWIKTHSISDTGIISNNPVDTLEYDDNTGLYPEVINVSGDVYAIVFRGPGNDGWVKTVRIGTDGYMDDNEIDSLEFETGNTRDAQITHVTGTIYAIAYEEDGSNDGWIKTVDIQQNGTLGGSFIDDYEFEGDDGRQPALQTISDTIVAIVYRGEGADGYVQTVEIDGSGNFVTAPVSTFEYDGADGSEPDIMHVGGDVYAIAYADPDSAGWISTVEILSNGTITPSIIDSYRYDDGDGDDPRIRHISGNVYAVVHQGSGNDGWLTTFTIQSSVSYDANSPSIQPTASFQDTQDVGQWTSFSETATLNGGTITYQLSEDDGITWFYWDGGSWTAATTSSESNTSGIVNTNIATFPTSTNNLMFQAFLNSDGTQEVQLDSISVSADRDMPGYADTIPTIQPSTSLGVADIDQWTAFTAVENTTGTIHYQLSSDAGSTWQYWNGLSWATAVGATDYNTSTPVNDNISTFTTSTKQLMFRGFLESDGTQQVQLDSVDVSWLIPPPDENVVGLWHMDEASGSLIDQSGNENDLTIVGDPLYNSSGKFDTAIDFDDTTGDYAKIDDIDQTGLDLTGAMTIEAWVNKTDAGNDYVVRKWTSGDARSYYVMVRADGSVRFEIKNSGDDIELNTATGRIQTGQWHHIAAVYDETNVYIFVDGVLADSASYSDGIQDGNAEFRISDNNSFRGRIDEVRISNIARWTSAFTPPAAPYGNATLTYPTDSPTIEPVDSYDSTTIDQWTSFLATSTLNGGNIYFQLSHDDGTTWKYWDGSDWSTSTLGTDYNTTSSIHSNIWQFPTSPSGTIKFKAFLESNGEQLIELDDVGIGCTNLQYEVGVVITDESWETITMQNVYKNPVVIGSVRYVTSTLPASVRVRNVSTSTFDIRLQHPSEADLVDDHEITYLVIEKGKWTIGGVQFEAHSYDTDTVGAAATDWDGDVMSYDMTYTTEPTVLHQVMTTNDTSWISTFVSEVGNRSHEPGLTEVAIGLNGSEVSSSHGTETIGWIVVERDDVGVIGTTVFETRRVSDSIRGYDEGCYTFDFDNSYSTVPLVLSSKQEVDSPNGGWGVTCSLDATQIGMQVDEDQVEDAERKHATVAFGFLAWEEAFSTSTLSTGGGLYKTSGAATSSAFNMGDSSPVQLIEWDEVLVDGSDIQFQLRTAPDSDGSPGTWTSWYGASGAGTFFTSPSTTLVSTDLNWNQWVQYKVVLTGDGQSTPVLSEVRVDYK